MSEYPQSLLRQQPAIRARMLVFGGTGHGPGCHQQKAIFSHRWRTQGSTKERCLACWKVMP